MIKKILRNIVFIGVGALSIMINGSLLMLFSIGSEEKLGGGYDFFQGRIFGPIGVPDEVLNFSHDRHFIIVKQLPTPYPNAMDQIRYNYPLGRDSVYYWIIDKDKTEVYGPISSQEFKLKCEELSISLFFRDSHETTPIRRHRKVN